MNDTIDNHPNVRNFHQNLDDLLKQLDGNEGLGLILGFPGMGKSSTVQHQQSGQIVD